MIKFICGVFFMLLFSCSGKDEQYQRDLDYIVKQQEIFLELENTKTKEIQKKMEMHSHGMDGQFAIRKYNSVNSKVDSGFKLYEKLRINRKILTPEMIDSVQYHVIGLLKEEINEISVKKKKILIPGDEKYLLKLLDSCLNFKSKLSPRLYLSSKKLELLVLKNKINEVFNNAYSSMGICCYGNPITMGLMIKNYQSNGASFLEIKYPAYMSRNSLKRLRREGKDSDDTIPVSEIKISYALDEYKQRDSSFFKIDLSRLKPGKYEIDACLRMVKPDNTVNPYEFYHPVQFEVFK